MTGNRVGALVLLAALFTAPAGALAGEVDEIRVVWPARRLWVGAEKVSGIQIELCDETGALVTGDPGPLTIEGLTLTSSPAVANGVVEVPPATVTAEQIRVSAGGRVEQFEVPTLYGGWALLPALVAILLALTTRQVLLSLFGGVWLGAALIHQGFFAAFPRSLDIIIDITADADKLKIIVFTMLMGGLVGIISNNGGTTGIVEVISKRATSRRSGAVATWAMGMLVFFDDYASSLLIGTTMRPITDRLKISREKLAYIVDSTAAPISSLALISTWIGYEVSVLGDALSASGIDRDPYAVFVAGIPSRFYPIFALLFVLIIGWFGKDFGPMLKAEQRARNDGKLMRDGAEPLMDANLVEETEEMKQAHPRWWMAAVPLVVLVGTVLLVLLVTGLGAAARDPAGFALAQRGGAIRVLGYILSNAASYDALVYAGGTSCGVAFVMSMRAMKLRKVIDAWTRGLRAMTLAVVVLCLAWSIGKVMNDLHAGTFVAKLIGSQVPGWALGAITFLLASVMAFATGTAWGTMAILFPIAIPVVAIHTGDPSFEYYLLGTSSAILAGAVFGDHCSPISDTTILSSIASASDHVDHTRTQVPYAVLCGLVALTIGYIPFGLGVPASILILVGVGVLIATVHVVGSE